MSSEQNSNSVDTEAQTNMVEVAFTLFSKTEILIVDTLEHEFLSSGDNSMLHFTFRKAFNKTFLSSSGQGQGQVRVR